MTDLVAADVTVENGVIAWREPDSSTVKTARQDELVCILRSANEIATSFYVLCLLFQEVSGPQTSFRPSFLKSATIPDTLLQEHLVDELPSHIRISSENQVDVIVSVKSGTDLALPFWETVLRPLLALAQTTLPTHAPVDVDHPSKSLAQPSEPHVLVTQDAQSVRRFARGLGARNVGQVGVPSRTILLLSGDGGVVDLLNGHDEDRRQTGIVEEESKDKPIIVLLPLGTGNALFHSLHKPVAEGTGISPLILALRTLFRGKPADLPTFRASFSPGACITSFHSTKASAGDDVGSGNAGGGSSSSSSSPQLELVKQQTPVSSLLGAIVASYGFHASIVYESDTPAYRVHGDKRFGMVAQELLRSSHAYTAHVDLRPPGAPAGSPMARIARSSHAYVLATPISNMERTFCISPRSAPLDGKLRLVHFGDLGGQRTMDVMMKAYDGGKHVGMRWEEDGEEVGYVAVDEVRVEVLEKEERWRKVCVDGTIVDIPEGGHISVAMEGDGRFRVLVDPRIAE